jgi:AraC-like DNA-binding protein
VGISKDLHSVMESEYAAIADVVRHIRRNLAAPLEVPELARRAGLSPYQLQRRIRLTFQLTAGQFIQKLRIEAALQKLRETAEPIAGIALDCGYADQSAFTRKFRQMVGISPSAYRTRGIT